MKQYVFTRSPRRITRPQGFIRKYVFSLDHKVIGIQYYFLALFSVLLGMSCRCSCASTWSTRTPRWRGSRTLWPTAAQGGIMTPELYLSLMTMHGTIMVFFVLTTVPQSGFGNYFLPIQIGAEDMAFPVLNMMSFWTTLAGSGGDGGGLLRAGRRAAVRLDRVSAAERRRAADRSRRRHGAERCGLSASRFSAAPP